MALTTPTIKQISDNIISQLEAELSQTIPLLPKAFNRVLAKTFAGIFILIYKYAGWMFLQIFVRTASFQETEILGKIVRPLVEWGRLIGIGDPGAATQAELLINITVENQTGQLDAGIQLFSAINGITYLLLENVLLDAPIVQGTIRAQSDVDGESGAGSIGNLQIDDIVSFVNPLENVARDTVVDSQTVTGADGETEENYRQRIIDRFQKQPQGGAGVDYEIWGEIPAGIVSILPYKGDPGIVDIYVEATPASSGNPDGIPTPAQLLEVENAIQFDADLRQTQNPVNAKLNVVSIIRTGFDITIYDLTVDDPVTIKAQIEDAVKTYLFERAPFIDGVTPFPAKNQINAQEISSIATLYVSAVNGFFSKLETRINGLPIILQFPYILGVGEKAKLSNIYYV